MSDYSESDKKHDVHMLHSMGYAQELERRMEACRLAETDPEALEVFRRGWCCGGTEFKRQMLERMEGKLGEHHAGELRRESATTRAERIIAEELARLGWSQEELAARPKSDPAKLAIAARLRKETTLTIKSIAARLHLGTSKSANARLHGWMRSNAVANTETGAKIIQS